MRLSIEGVSAGISWANVFWIRNGNGQTPGQGDLDAAVDDWVNEYILHPHSLAYVGVIVTTGSAIYYGPSGGDLGSERSFTGAGTKASNPLPNNVACCVGWTIQQRYRGGHPRTYLPSTDAEQLTDGRLFDTSYVQQAKLQCDTWHRGINANTHGALSDLHLGTVSFVLRGEWRTPPIFRDYTLDGARVDQRVDTMRRRLGPDIV